MVSAIVKLFASLGSLSLISAFLGHTHTGLVPLERHDFETVDAQVLGGKLLENPYSCGCDSFTPMVSIHKVPISPMYLRCWSTFKIHASNDIAVVTGS